ncbi:MAG TPA: SRPBCC family protein [Enhygromyxa sp.]|nr:SRPBCC family protein [Enhygromyxa sp.]
MIPVATAMWEGFVFINLDPRPVPIEQAFGPLLGRLAPWQISRLELAARVEYEVAANWKLLFQNFSECYHCPIVHPKLNRITPFDADTDPAFPPRGLAGLRADPAERALARVRAGLLLGARERERGLRSRYLDALGLVDLAG